MCFSCIYLFVLHVLDFVFFSLPLGVGSWLRFDFSIKLFYTFRSETISLCFLILNTERHFLNGCQNPLSDFRTRSTGIYIYNVCLVLRHFFSGLENFGAIPL